MTAMFSCELVVNSISLGKVYDVLNRRNGRILGEEMKVCVHQGQSSLS